MRSIMGERQIEIFLPPFFKLAKDSEQWFIKNAICSHCQIQYRSINAICLCNEISIAVIPIELDDEYQSIADLETKRLRNYCRKIHRKENLENSDGFYGKEDIQEIYKIQIGSCYYCKEALKDSAGKTYFEVDHIFPLALGGDQWPTNLALACRRCNRKKGHGDEDSLWRYLRKEIGIKAVNASRKINKTHYELKLALIKKENEFNPEK